MKSYLYPKKTRGIFLSFTLIIIWFFSATSCGQHKPTRLIVRADDMGMAHAVNLACIQTYEQGIVKTVELMVPSPWFPEAVRLLKEHPKLDVGIHLTLTSEWDNIKSRPLTKGTSFTDDDGFFYPMVTPLKGYEGQSLSDHTIDLQEVEAELKAQIELAIKHLPDISHVSAHMGFTRLNGEINSIFRKLARTYQLDIFLDEKNVKYVSYLYEDGDRNKEKGFIKMLESLQPGDYMFLDHPGFDNLEMQGIYHSGYENVAEDRSGVTDLFTNDKIKAKIEALGIKLISYQDLK